MGSIPALPFWPANETETLLEAACRDPSQREGFFRSLRTCQLFVLCDPENLPTIEAGKMPAGSTLRLRLMEVEGVEAIIAFTSRELLSFSLPEGTPFVVMAGEDLFHNTRMSPISINPKGPFGKLLTSEEIRLALSGMVPREYGSVLVDPGMRVRFARMANPPAHLLAALRQACGRCAAIRAAYVGFINYPEVDDHAVLLVGVECDGDFAVAAGAVQTAASQVHDLPHGKIDVLNVGAGSENDSFAQTVRSTGLKFYRRSWMRK